MRSQVERHRLIQRRALVMGLAVSAAAHIAVLALTRIHVPAPEEAAEQARLRPSANDVQVVQLPEREPPAPAETAAATAMQAAPASSVAQTEATGAAVSGPTTDAAPTLPASSAVSISLAAVDLRRDARTANRTVEPVAGGQPIVAPDVRRTVPDAGAMAMEGEDDEQEGGGGLGGILNGLGGILGGVRVTIGGQGGNCGGTGIGGGHGGGIGGGIGAGGGIGGGGMGGRPGDATTIPQGPGVRPPMGGMRPPPRFELNHTAGARGCSVR